MTDRKEARTTKVRTTQAEPMEVRTLVVGDANPDIIYLAKVNAADAVNALINDPVSWVQTYILPQAPKGTTQILGNYTDIVTVNFVYPVGDGADGLAAVEVIQDTNVITVRTPPLSSRTKKRHPFTTAPPAMLNICLVDGVAFCHYHTTPDAGRASAADVLANIENAILHPTSLFNAFNDENRFVQNCSTGYEQTPVATAGRPVKFKTTVENDLRFIFQWAAQGRRVDPDTVEPCVKPQGTYAAAQDADGSYDVTVDTILFMIW